MDDIIHLLLDLAKAIGAFALVLLALMVVWIIVAAFLHMDDKS